MEVGGDFVLAGSFLFMWTPKLAARVSAATIRGKAPGGPATPKLPPRLLEPDWRSDPRPDFESSSPFWLPDDSV